jgi:hypothetical protein
MDVDGVGGDVQLLRVGRGASRGGGGDLGLGGRGQVGPFDCAQDCGSRLHSGLRQSGAHPCRRERVMDGAPGTRQVNETKLSCPIPSGPNSSHVTRALNRRVEVSHL